MTLAWSREHFGGDRSIGTNGITSAVLAATTRAGEPFPAPRTVVARDGVYRTPPVVTAAGGRVAMTWGIQGGRRDFGVQAVAGRPVVYVQSIGAPPAPPVVKLLAADGS